MEGFSWFVYSCLLVGLIRKGGMNETNTNTAGHHGRDQEIRIHYRQASDGDHGMRLSGQHGLCLSNLGAHG